MTYRHQDPHPFHMVGFGAPSDFATVGYFVCTPAASNRATTADPAAITGDIDLRVYATLNNPGLATEQWMVGKGDAGVTYGLTDCQLDPERITVVWDDTSTTQNVNSDVGIVLLGRGRWYRGTLDLDNGSSEHVVTFYYSDDPPTTDPASVTWTLHSTHTVAGVSALSDSAYPVNVGSRASSRRLQGTVAYAEVRNGIAGTIVANPDFRYRENGAPPWTSLTDTAGQAWSWTGSWVLPKMTAHVSAPIVTGDGAARVVARSQGVARLGIRTAGAAAVKATAAANARLSIRTAGAAAVKAISAANARISMRAAGAATVIVRAFGTIAIRASGIATAVVRGAAVARLQVRAAGASTVKAVAAGLPRLQIRSTVAGTVKVVGAGVPRLTMTAAGAGVVVVRSAPLLNIISISGMAVVVARSTGNPRLQLRNGAAARLVVTAKGGFVIRVGGVAVIIIRGKGGVAVIRDWPSPAPSKESRFLSTSVTSARYATSVGGSGVGRRDE